MSRAHKNRHRQIVHDFTGVTHVSLQKHGLLMTAAARFRAIIKDAFAAVTDKVGLVVAGQGLRKGIVVGQYLTVLIAGEKTRSSVDGSPSVTEQRLSRRYARCLAHTTKLQRYEASLLSWCGRRQDVGGSRRPWMAERDPRERSRD